MQVSLNKIEICDTCTLHWDAIQSEELQLLEELVILGLVSESDGGGGALGLKSLMVLM